MATPTGLEPDREIRAALTRFLMGRMLPAKRTILAIGDPVRVLALVFRVRVIPVLTRLTSQYDGVPWHLLRSVSRCIPGPAGMATTSLITQQSPQ